MADVSHARGVKLVLKIGDGADPENFVARCSINAERSLSGEVSTNDFNIPDCADPDALAWVTSEKVALRYSFSGAGILDTNDVLFFHNFLKDPDARNCQVIVDVPAADGGVIFEGPWHLNQFQITGDRGTKQECSIGMFSNAEITVTANV